MKVALTHSEGRLEGLEAALTAHGYGVVRVPLIETVPVPSEAARGLLECDWLLFSSRSTLEAWDTLGLPLRGVRPHLGAVGERTAAAIRHLGGAVILVGEPQNAQGLADAFLRAVRPPATVGLPCGDRALGTLGVQLCAAGFEVRKAVVYETRACPWKVETVDVVDVVVLASPSAVAALPEGVGARAKLVALGPSTAAAIAGRGWGYVQADAPEAGAVLSAIERTL